MQIHELNNSLPFMNKILDVFEDVDEAIRESNDNVSIPFWFAGGCIRSAIDGDKINDFDLFSPRAVEIKEILMKKNHCSFTDERVSNFWINNNKIQVVTRFAPSDVEVLFRTFDFSIVMAACDGKNLICDDRFLLDVAQKRLVIVNLTFPLNTLQRTYKYVKRGYNICPVAIKTLAQTINGMEIDWNNPSEDIFSFYPDGTPRFGGVD